MKIQKGDFNISNGPKDGAVLRISFDMEEGIKFDSSSRWRDLRFPAMSVKVSGSKPPTWVDYKGGQVLAFSDQAIAGNEEYIYFNVQLEHEWVQGTDLHPHVHWIGEDNTAGNCYWRLTYSWADIGSAFPDATAIYKAAANGVTDTHLVHAFENISGIGHGGVSGMLLCSLSRHSSNSLDTLTAKKAYLLEVDFHIEVDDLGSKTEYAR